MPGEQPSQPHSEERSDETPFSPKLERRGLTDGSESMVDELGPDYVVKKLYDVDPKSLADQRTNYQDLRRTFGERIPKSMFVRGKDDFNVVRNQVVQERVEGDTMQEINLKAATAVDLELREDVLALSAEVGKALRGGKRLPDLGKQNLIVRPAGEKPRIAIVDIGSSWHEPERVAERLGDAKLMLDAYDDLDRQLQSQKGPISSRDLPQNYLLNLEYLSNRASLAVQQLEDWYGGTWSPTDEQGVHGVDEAGFKPISVVFEKHAKDLTWMLKHQPAAQDFRSAFIEKFGEELRAALFTSTVGRDVQDARIRQRLVRALFAN